MACTIWRSRAVPLSGGPIYAADIIFLCRVLMVAICRVLVVFEYRIHPLEQFTRIFLADWAFFFIICSWNLEIFT